VILKMGINMDMELSYLQMVTIMKDYMLMVNLKVMVYISGKIELSIKGSLKMG
jgi:hypothetical protein